MAESLRTFRRRWLFNLFPAYFGTGARISFLAEDLREIRIRLPLSLRTRNYVGTIFGGSMYAAVDPIYMIMLIENLGPGYVVWDKGATLRFRKPGRSTLYATCRIDEGELDAIREELSRAPSTTRTYTIDLVDAEGTVHASVEKLIYVSRREKE